MAEPPFTTWTLSTISSPTRSHASARARTSADLTALDLELLGKRSELSERKAGLGKLPPEERRDCRPCPQRGA